MWAAEEPPASPLAAQRQLDSEGGALARLARCANGSPVIVDNLPRDEEAQPQAAKVPYGDGALELVEDLRQRLRLDAHALVTHREISPAALGAEPDMDGLPTAVLEFENEDELPVLVDVSADESC